MAVSLSTISEVGIGFLSLFGGFFKAIAPPEGAAKIWTGVASLMAGIGFLAVKLLPYTSSNPFPAKFWAGVALAVIAASIVLFFTYDLSREKHTVPLGGSRRIAGSEADYAPAAQTYLATHPNYTRAQMLFDFAGNAERVWNPGSLRRARLILGVEYAAFIALLAFALNLGVEVLANPAPDKAPAFKDRISNVKDVHFALDRSDMDADASERLADDAAIVVPVFRDFPKATLIVEGYCDDQGSVQYNLALGNRRAEAVKQALAQKGLSAQRMRVASHGNTTLLCTERSEECRQKNRRVQLTAIE